MNAETPLTSDSQPTSSWRRLLASLFMVLLLTVSTAPLVGCAANDDDTVGEKIDEGIEEAGDAIEEAGDDIEDATDG